MAKLAYLTKKDAVAEHLRDEILAGLLAGGTTLQQEEVARRLGVSPTPVREAFQTLEAEGLLEIRPHRGVVVLEQTYVDVADIYEIRSLLEVAALRRCLVKVDNQLIASLRAASNRAKQALKPRLDVHAFRQASAQFHREIVEASGSRVYAALVERLIARSTYFVPLNGVRMRGAHRQHVAILAALEAGDPKRVMSLMQEHMNDNLRSGETRLTMSSDPRLAHRVRWSVTSHNGRTTQVAVASAEPRPRSRGSR